MSAKRTAVPAKRARNRRPSIKALAKQAEQAGLAVTSVEYRVDGTVVVHTGQPAGLDVAKSGNDNKKIKRSPDPGWN